ncbi:unnamed protein product, partial [Amoebophrya sp. A120]
GLERLPVAEQQALLAVGDDREDLLRAAYTRLACSLVAQQRYEEALQICDLVDGVHVVDQIFMRLLRNFELPSSPWIPCAAQPHAHAAFLQQGKGSAHEYLYRLQDPELAAKLVLRLYRYWDNPD